MTTRIVRHSHQHAGVSVTRVIARISWFVAWALVTAFVWFEVVKHGYIHGGWSDALALTAAAVGFFVAPDLTFLVAAGEPVEKGRLPSKAVPFYNAMHRFWPPALLAAGVGVGLAPLNTGTLTLFVGCLAWMAHVALDRTAGYGLRNPDGSR